jgi:hypothetical protein
MSILTFLVILIVIGIIIYLIMRRHSSRSLAEDLRTYQVKVENLTRGQPLSPPVFFTHGPGISLFHEGGMANQAINDLSRDGNSKTIVSFFSGLPDVTDLVTLPNEILGNLKDNGSSQATFIIKARPGDLISGGSMLSCSNNGFMGLDSGSLPGNIGATAVYDLEAYDAGRELNTEKREDIPNPCSVAGLISLRGPPSNNRDTEVDRIPPRPIQVHEGIRGVGDLSSYYHGWEGPVAHLTIQRIE